MTGKTIKKADIINHLHNTLGFNKTECKEIIEHFFNEIVSSLDDYEKVKISGFGNFEVIEKNERPGRNPKTGENVTISSRRVVSFKASKKLRKLVSTYEE